MKACFKDSLFKEGGILYNECIVVKFNLAPSSDVSAYFVQTDDFDPFNPYAKTDTGNKSINIEVFNCSNATQ